VSERLSYLVHTTSSSEPDLAAVCASVYEAVSDRIEVAYVDAFSDFHDSMPDDIKAVEGWLRELSAHQTQSGDGMAVKVQPTDSPGWDFVRAYTPWSIHVEAFDTAMKNVVTFHDCGVSIIAFLSTTEAAALAAALPPGHEIEPLIQQ
jgi:hypothetical protein